MCKYKDITSLLIPLAEFIQSRMGYVSSMLDVTIGQQNI